jgi:hypothetical protein
MPALIGKGNSDMLRVRRGVFDFPKARALVWRATNHEVDPRIAPDRVVALPAGVRPELGCERVGLAGTQTGCQPVHEIGPPLVARGAHASAASLSPKQNAIPPYDRPPRGGQFRIDSQEKNTYQVEA